ncbi:SDR family NAD(P)-dependent oxidoreductase [Agrococcus carbonis]|uniref:3-oxoacyl-[acyl-carrier protein] reductase n=1 Tax=Agrococcus carbonis TaxID=684552 RepID=A0A1H1LP24_9MICO|nr:SDR family oxidoreductase [Agrococcus carbonis]SDR76323.1 3-oxoacyl-[acyl-carrier protein] reductase [Agrococcus carbonis]
MTGAGRGLGAAIATALAADGCAVAVNDLPESSGAAAVVDAVQAAGGEAILAPGDVTTPEGVGAAVAAAEDAFGPIDVLVPCATGPQPEAAVEHMTWEDLLLPLRFFTLSPLLLVQAVLPGMRAAGGGRVVIIGSDLAQRTDVGWSAYSAAKAAQLALVRTWARELAADGINVNAVAPGWIPVERHASTAPEHLAAYTARVPLGRMGTPADVAGAVVWLASSAASFVTGEQVTVNGGHRLT